ncbi:MAG: ABC transporter substrate-binding protein [Chloroflexi bacterium]|nr:ABC transporter substrate-binding protein [Chloroflexota bacterium]
MAGFVTRRAFLRGIIAAGTGLAVVPLLDAASAAAQPVTGLADLPPQLRLAQIGGGSQLPVNVPREQVYVADQIFRYSVANNFNLFVPNGPPNPTRQGLVFDSLWYLDQNSGQWINSLASDKPTYSPDWTQMTVPLRQGIMWSDGVEFTSDDVAFTVQSLMNTPGLFNSAEMKLYVKDVSAPDKYTVVFNLNEPNPRFHTYFTVRYNAVYIMAKHVWQNASDLNTFTNYPPVSLGAYVVQDADPNGFWELFKLRDDWQNTTPGLITGKPGPTYLLTIFYGAGQQKVIAMARHDLDVLFDLDYEAFKPLIDGTPTARSWYQDFPWAYANELDTRVFGFNHTMPPYDNKDVRWALALALDVVGLQTNYVGGVAKVTPIPIPASPLHMSLYHVPMQPWFQSLTIDLGNGESFQPYDADVPNKIAAWAQQQGYSVPSDADGIRERFGVGSWKYAPDAATKLLTKNGFTKTSDGHWLLPDGTPWKITFIVAQDENDAYRLALGAQDQWKAFGIDVEVDALERTPWQTRQNTGDFVATSAWAQFAVNATADIWQGLNSEHSRFFTPIGQSVQGNGSSNPWRFKLPELDPIIDQMGKLSPDDPQVLDLGRQAMQLWVENMLTITTVSFKKFITQDQQYWMGFPTAENPTVQPLYWFQGGRFMFPLLTPTPR